MGMLNFKGRLYVTLSKRCRSQELICHGFHHEETQPWKSQAIKSSVSALLVYVKWTLDCFDWKLLPFVSVGYMRDTWVRKYIYISKLC